MKSFQYVITDSEGIHARPAGMFVKEAGKFQSSINISCHGKTGDAKRIFSVMGLAVKSGEEITVTCEGADEQEAATSLESFFKENL